MGQEDFSLVNAEKDSVNENQNVGDTAGDLKTVKGWQPIETAPRDGREMLMTDGKNIRICYPKLFPRPITEGDDLAQVREGDLWEYFRDDLYAPGHTWSMAPTHWMPLPDLPVTRKHKSYCGLRSDHEGACVAIVTRALGV